MTLTFQNVIMATETSNYYLFLYDATTGQKISQEGSAQEGYFGICGYSIDAQPTTPDGNVYRGSDMYVHVLLPVHV